MPQMGIMQQNYSINYPHSFSNEIHNELQVAVNTEILKFCNILLIDSNYKQVNVTIKSQIYSYSESFVLYLFYNSEHLNLISNIQCLIPHLTDCKEIYSTSKLLITWQDITLYHCWGGTSDY